MSSTGNNNFSTFINDVPLFPSLSHSQLMDDPAPSLPNHSFSLYLLGDALSSTVSLCATLPRLHVLCCIISPQIFLDSFHILQPVVTFIYASCKHYAMCTYGSLYMLIPVCAKRGGSVADTAFLLCQRFSFHPGLCLKTVDGECRCFRAGLSYDGVDGNQYPRESPE